VFQWQSPDLNEAQINRLQGIYKELSEIFPDPIKVDNTNNMTPEQAALVRIAVRRNLLMTLLSQEYHWHEVDDCGDYLTAATDNWSALYSNLWNDDFQDEIGETRKFLTDFDAYPIGGSDGEIRHDILPEGWEGYDA